MSTLISQRSLLPTDGHASKSYPANSEGGKKKRKKKNGRKGCREGEILLRSLGQIMQDKRAAASG